MRQAILLAALLALLAVAPASANLPWLGQPVTAFAPADLPVFAQSAALNPEGTVLYVLSNNGLIYEYSTTTGHYIGGWGGFGHGPGQFFAPSALTVDPYGNVWVADTGNGRVQKLDAGGKYLMSIATPQPVGIAAGTAEVYVLSGVLRAVSERSWAGKDAGGYIATFPQGFDFSGHYAAPSNSAVSIAADSAGHSAVIGTVTQALQDPERPSCKSPLSTLDPLPDPLVAPAETVFDDHGNALRESYPFDAGAICWTDNPLRWSYGLTGRQGRALAVDPVTNAMYATTSEGDGPWWVVDEEQRHLGIWDASVGPTPETTGLATSLYGPIRAFAIGCDSALYLVTYQRIEKFSVANPDTSRCHARSRFLDQSLTIVPALGKAPPAKGAGKATTGLSFGTVLCRGATRCAGKVSLTLAACAHCRALAVLAKTYKISGGGTKPLSLTVPASIRRRVARGLPLLASARVGAGGPATTFALRTPTTLTARCGSALQLGGALSPARKGLLVTVTLAGAGGAPVVLTTRTDARGRWALQPPAPGDGAWTATALVAGTRALAPAQASCGAVIGPPPSPLLGAAPAGRAVSAVDLALVCPAAGTVARPLTVTGRLTPADGGVAVTLTAGAEAAGATTAADGTFAATFLPGAAGDLTVTARARDVGADLTRGCTVPVAKAPSALTAACSPSTAIPWPGHDGRVSGALSPASAGATIAVTFSQPGQPAQTRTAATDASGAYAVLFEPPAPGDWSAQAAWAGDAAHDGASAASCALHYG